MFALVREKNPSRNIGKSETKAYEIFERGKCSKCYSSVVITLNNYIFLILCLCAHYKSQKEIFPEEIEQCEKKGMFYRVKGHRCCLCAVIISFTGICVCRRWIQNLIFQDDRGYSRVLLLWPKMKKKIVNNILPEICANKKCRESSDK